MWVNNNTNSVYMLITSFSMPDQTKQEILMTSIPYIRSLCSIILLIMFQRYVWYIAAAAVAAAAVFHMSSFVVVLNFNLTCCVPLLLYQTHRFNHEILSFYFSLVALVHALQINASKL